MVKGILDMLSVPHERSGLKSARMLAGPEVSLNGGDSILNPEDRFLVSSKRLSLEIRDWNEFRKNLIRFIRRNAKVLRK